MQLVAYGAQDIYLSGYTSDYSNDDYNKNDDYDNDYYDNDNYSDDEVVNNNYVYATQLWDLLVSVWNKNNLSENVKQYFNIKIRKYL